MLNSTIHTEHKYTSKPGNDASDSTDKADVFNLTQAAKTKSRAKAAMISSSSAPRWMPMTRSMVAAAMTLLKSQAARWRSAPTP